MDGRACTLDELIEDAKRLADSIPTNLSLTKTSIGKAELYTISPTPSPTLEHAKPSTFKSSVRNAFPLFVEEGPSDLIGKEAPQKINFPTIPKRGVAMTKTITSPKGVYYKCGHEGERVPVAVGDLVVRVHNKVENETEDNNKWNILDGPFRIVKFDRSNRIWTCSNEGDEHMNKSVFYFLYQDSSY
jgi:hypothetical protein